MNITVWTFIGDPARRRLLSRLIHKLQEEAWVQIRDTVNLYPDFFLDTVAEKQMLELTDTVIMLHPWVSFGPPAMTKEWMDRILHRNYAWGDPSRKFRERRWMHVVSMGGGHPRTESGLEVEMLLAPYRRMVEFCGMHWLPPEVLIEPPRNHPESRLDERLEPLMLRIESLLKEDA